MGIKTIIFDLGDVLLPVNKEKTYRAFNALGVVDAKSLFEKKPLQQLYLQYERDLPTSEFRRQLRTILHVPDHVTDEQIDAAWLAMLEPIPKERLDYILRLKEAGYEVILLSNSNAVHHRYIQQHYGEQFSARFHAQYYSHLLKMSKPGGDIFQHVIKGKNPKECLFLDDNAANIAAAKSQGIHAMQLKAHQSMTLVDNMLCKLNREDVPYVPRGRASLRWFPPHLAKGSEGAEVAVRIQSRL